MSGHTYFQAGTGGTTASGGTLVDILGSAGFTAKQVVIVNDHGALTLTLNGLGFINSPTILPGEAFTIPGSVKRFRVEENTTTATFRVLASDSIMPAAKIEEFVFTAGSIAADSITTVMIQDEAVTVDKIAAAIAGAGLTGGAGAPLAVVNTNGGITVTANSVDLAAGLAGDGLTLTAGVLDVDVAGVEMKSALGIVSPAIKDITAQGVVVVIPGAAMRTGIVTTNPAGPANLDPDSIANLDTAYGTAVYVAGDYFDVNVVNLSANVVTFNGGAIAGYTNVGLMTLPANTSATFRFIWTNAGVAVSIVRITA